MSAERIVAKIGTAKPSVVCSASGRSMIAPKLKAMLVSPITLRFTCAPKRCVLSEASPGPARTATSTTGTARPCRQNMISGSFTPASLASLISTVMIERQEMPNNLSPSARRRVS